MAPELLEVLGDLPAAFLMVDADAGAQRRLLGHYDGLVVVNALFKRLHVETARNKHDAIDIALAEALYYSRFHGGRAAGIMEKQVAAVPRAQRFEPLDNVREKGVRDARDDATDKPFPLRLLRGGARGKIEAQCLGRRADLDPPALRYRRIIAKRPGDGRRRDAELLGDIGDGHARIHGSIKSSPRPSLPASVTETQPLTAELETDAMK